EYQQGQLVGFQTREYVLYRDQHACVYCDATGVVLNLDHVIARSRGVSDRVSNLAAVGIPCNPVKAGMPVEEFVTSRARLSRITSRLKTRSEEHTSELQSRFDLVCRLLLEKKNIRQ